MGHVTFTGHVIDAVIYREELGFVVFGNGMFVSCTSVGS